MTPARGCSSLSNRMSLYENNRSTHRAGARYSNGVRAATYYVSTSGNDGNNGTSLSTPWRTINKAAQTMVAGDTVYVRGGTYREVCISRE